jgi:2-keto-4-pentenoate hydratase/2-oxohepta-3-ene-1,7-dioic acid hydratase in catechol pathway
MKSVSFANQDVFPSKIVCVGRNFVDHIVELGNEVPTEPVIFIKPNTAIGENLLSVRDEAIHYEGELWFRFNKTNVTKLLERKGIALGTSKSI